MANDKTNVMRILDQKKISYNDYSYDPSETNGEEVAKLLQEDPNYVYKTLVTVSNDRKNYVFIIPVNKELDLKKCAKAVGCKNIEMIKQKELLPLTGYIHGGCSPIGMKKLFPTFLDSNAIIKDYIFVSGGRVGRQIRINPKDLCEITKASLSDLVKV